MTDKEVYRWLHDAIMNYADGDPQKQMDLDLEINQYFEHNLRLENLSPEAQEIVTDFERVTTEALREG